MKRFGGLTLRTALVLIVLGMIIGVFASLGLLDRVDRFTDPSPALRTLIPIAGTIVFVFGMLISAMIIHHHQGSQQWRPRHERRDIMYELFLGIIIAGIFGWLCLLTFPQLLSTADSSVKLEITSIPPLDPETSQAIASEVWIVEIQVNGKAIALDRIPLDDGWAFSGGLVTGRLYRPLHLSFPTRNVTLRFLKHNWSGTVEIIDGSVTDIIELWDPGELTTEYQVRKAVDSELDRPFLERYLLVLLLIASLAVCVSIVLSLIPGLRLFTVLAVGGYAVLAWYATQIGIIAEPFFLWVSIIGAIATFLVTTERDPFVFAPSGPSILSLITAIAAWYLAFTQEWEIPLSRVVTGGLPFSDEVIQTILSLGISTLIWYPLIAAVPAAMTWVHLRGVRSGHLLIPAYLVPSWKEVLATRISSFEDTGPVDDNARSIHIEQLVGSYVFQLITAGSAAFFSIQLLQHVAPLDADKANVITVAIFASAFLLLQRLRDSVYYEKTFRLRSRIIVSACVATLLTIAAIPSLVYTPYVPGTVTMTLLEERNPDSSGREAWLLDVHLGERDHLVLSEIEIPPAWVYRDPGIILTTTPDMPLTLQLPARAVTLEFLSHPWSGYLLIDDGGVLTTIDLWAPENTTLTYEVMSNQKLDDGSNRFKSFLLACVWYYTLFFTLIALAVKDRRTWVPIMGSLTILVFSSPLAPWDHRILVLLSMAAGGILANTPGLTFRSYLSGPFRILIIVLTLWLITLATFFDIIFFNPETGRLMFSLEYFTFSLLFMLWLLPLILSLFRVFDIFQEERTPRHFSHAGERASFGILLFAITMMIWVGYLVVYYPGVMTTDSVHQYYQATGVRTLNDAHPAIHTLFIRLALLIDPVPALPILGQICFMSFVVASLLSWFSTKGIPRWAVILFAAIFALIPSNGMQVITLWKDIPFTATLLWLSYWMMRFVDEPDTYGSTWFDLIQLFLALALTPLLRHNGIVTVALAIPALIILAWRHRRTRIILVIGFALIIIMGKGPLFDRLGILPDSPGVKLWAPINDLAGLVARDYDIPPETEEFMTDIMPLELWKEYYSPYNPEGYHLRAPLEVPFRDRIDELETSLVIKEWVRNFFRHPIAIAYARLTSLHELWVIPSMSSIPIDRYFTQCDLIGERSDDSPIRDWMNALLWSTRDSSTLDMVFWRTGLMTALLGVCVTYWIIRRRWRPAVSAIPVLATILSLILSMLWQNFRYVYFIYAIVPFLILYTLTDGCDTIAACPDSLEEVLTEGNSDPLSEDLTMRKEPDHA